MAQDGSLLVLAISSGYFTNLCAASFQQSTPAAEAEAETESEPSSPTIVRLLSSVRQVLRTVAADEDSDEVASQNENSSLPNGGVEGHMEWAKSDDDEEDEVQHLPQTQGAVAADTAAAVPVEEQIQRPNPGDSPKIYNSLDQIGGGCDDYETYWLKKRALELINERCAVPASLDNVLTLAVSLLENRNRHDAEAVIMSILAYFVNDACVQEKCDLFDRIVILATHTQKLAEKINPADRGLATDYSDLAEHLALVLISSGLKLHVGFRLLGILSLARNYAASALNCFKLALSETPVGTAPHGDLKQLTNDAETQVQRLQAQEELSGANDVTSVQPRAAKKPRAQPVANQGDGMTCGVMAQVMLDDESPPPLNDENDEEEADEGPGRAMNDQERWREIEEQAEAQREMAGSEPPRPSDAAYEKRLRIFHALHAPRDDSLKKKCASCKHVFSLSAFSTNKCDGGVRRIKTKCKACLWRNIKVDSMLQAAKRRHLERGYEGVATITRELLEAEIAQPDIVCSISCLRGTDRASCLPWMWSVDEIVPGLGYHPHNYRLVVLEMNVRGGADGERLSREHIVSLCKSVIGRINGETEPPTQDEFHEWYLQDGIKDRVREMITEQHTHWLQRDRAKGRETMDLDRAVLRFEEARGECFLSYLPLPLEGICRFSGDRTDNEEGHIFCNVNYVLGFLNCMGVIISEEEGGGVGEGMSERKVAQLVLGQRGQPEFDGLWTPEVVKELERRAAMDAPWVYQGGNDDNVMDLDDDDDDDDDYSGVGGGTGNADVDCAICHKSFLTRLEYVPDQGGVFMCEGSGVCVECSADGCSSWRYVTKAVNRANEKLFCSKGCGGARHCGKGGWSVVTAMQVEV